MTSRNLFVRVAEHAGRSYRTGRILTVPPHSVVREHAERCHVPIRIANFKVLDSSSCSSDLRILESLHIHKRKPKLNIANSS